MENIDSEEKNKILVVEDEPSVSIICERVLTGEGYVVDVATNSGVAQDMIKETRYDLVLLDIKMPGINGVDMYKWMEDEPKGMSERVVFTTGSVMTTTVTDFISQTGRPFLPKPFTPVELTAIIKQTLKD